MMKDPEIYKCIERIADVVLFRSASSVFERLILYRTTGVLLWGPPGCGKSGISEEYCRRFDRMYFINTDEIVEFILKTWMTDNLGLVKNGASDDVKQEIYWKIRDLTFSSLGDEKSVLLEIFNGINIPHHTFLDSEFSEFKSQSCDISNVISAVSSFLIFLAKFRNQNFMVETTGNLFDREWAGLIYAGTNSILNVVYVSTTAELSRRVSTRKDQLINATTVGIIDSTLNSYQNQLRSAILSGIFCEIIITSNDKRPAKTLMVLQKDLTKNKYRTTVNLPSVLNAGEKVLIEDLFSVLGLSMFVDDYYPLSAKAELCLCSHVWTVLK